MQEQAFRIQKEFFIKIKDFQMLDMDEDVIREILKKAKVSNKMINNLMEGIFTPINFSKPRFETKVENLEDVAEQKTEKSKKYGWYVDEDFVYPRDELQEVVDEWTDKEFFVETWNEETGQMEGGYYPEEQGTIKDDKGKLVYDEYGQLVKEKTFLQKSVPIIKEQIKKLISPISGLMSKAEAAPLKTPMPDKRLVASAPQINQQTGLTRTESALLSPSEQVIARRT